MKIAYISQNHVLQEVQTRITGNLSIYHTLEWAGLLRHDDANRRQYRTRPPWSPLCVLMHPLRVSDLWKTRRHTFARTKITQQQWQNLFLLWNRKKFVWPSRRKWISKKVFKQQNIRTAKNWCKIEFIYASKSPVFYFNYISCRVYQLSVPFFLASISFLTWTKIIDEIMSHAFLNYLNTCKSM